MAEISKIKLLDNVEYDIKDAKSRMVILKYGISTWSDFISAYGNNCVVYCRASSNTNPATGSQNRLAFMAYVNDSASPTEVEFQYYRSVATHTDSQQGDQVYVYKLNSSGTWSVTVRSAFSKVIAGSNLTSSYASSAITLNADYDNAVTEDSTKLITSGAVYDAIEAIPSTSIQTITTAQWEALTPEQQASGDYVISDGQVSGIPLSAQFIPYSNTTSGLTADNVQEAIDELAIIPAPPATDGQYVLSVTVSSGVPTYAWITPSGGGSGIISTSVRGGDIPNVNENTIRTVAYTEVT